MTLRKIGGRKLYKVVDSNGRAIWGRYQFNLPVGGKLGKWAKLKAQRLIMCKAGFHVTVTPERWGAGLYERRVFEVEILDPKRYPRGAGGGIICEEGNKYIARGIRLLREVKYNTAEWRRVMALKRVNGF